MGSNLIPAPASWTEQQQPAVELDQKVPSSQAGGDGARVHNASFHVFVQAGVSCVVLEQTFCMKLTAIVNSISS